MYLLDTNICVPLINRTDAAIAKRFLVETPDSVVLCSVVRAELDYGAHKSKHVAANIDRIEKFCSGFVSLAFDDAAAARYGSLRAHLRREGTPIGHNDMLIASIALAHELVLVTRNLREFRRVPGLSAERW